MSDKETATADSETDTAEDLSDVQAWNDVTGQDTIDASALDSEDEQTDAASDQEADEPAEEAVSDAEDDGDGQQPAKQQSKPDVEVKRLRGQVSGKDRKIRELQQQIAEERRKRQEASRSAEANPKDLDDLKETYPDIVNPLLKEIEDIRSRLDPLSQSVDRMSELHESSLEADFAAETQVFRELRPTGTEVVRKNADTFWKWVEDQPKKDRDLAYSSQDAIQDGEAMAELLNRFDAHLGVSAAPNEPDPSGSSQKRGAPSTARSARLAGAKTMPSRGSSPASTKPSKAEMDEVAAWNYVTGQ